MFLFIWSIFMVILCLVTIIVCIVKSDGVAFGATIMTLLLLFWIDTLVDEWRTHNGDEVEATTENVITVKNYEVTTNYSVTNGDTTIVNYTIKYEDIEEGI